MHPPSPCRSLRPSFTAPLVLAAALSSAPALAATGDAVGLAVEVDNGVAKPLELRAGTRFYVQQIDLRGSIESTADEGVAGLATSGELRDLSWKGTMLADEDFDGNPAPDGTRTRRRYFRRATWMERPGLLALWQVDAKGHAIGIPTFLSSGSGEHRTPSDSFFVRRMRAIQWTYGCATITDCSTATGYQEEGLVELRNSMHPDRTFTLDPKTTALRLWWSEKPTTTYTIPVTQQTQSSVGYGFEVGIDALTPTTTDGTYAPGTDVTFQLGLRDAAGNRLHPPGTLPSYMDATFGDSESGISYYRAFFDPTILYYRRKHRERNMVASIMGPAQKIQAVRTVVPVEAFFQPSDVIHVGTRERDGVFLDVKMFPAAYGLFGGAFDPSHAAWFEPVSDTWTFHLPEDAEPGTYLVTVKSRRVERGEDVPAAKTIEIQVGTPVHTEASLPTGGCNACHTGQSKLDHLLHGTGNRAACNSCHVPLGNELDNGLASRVHFVHSRSDRFDADLAKCSTCHVEQASIQRTSKSACLSCHQSYPANHVAAFGPIQSMSVGGGEESFTQCTGSCHVDHPRSGF